MSIGIALVAGWFVLLGTFLSLPAGLARTRLTWIGWASMLAAVALVLGVVNLIGVHWRRAADQRPGWFYSIVLIAGLVVTFGITAWTGPAGAASGWIFRYVQLPSEAALSALLAVTLAVAGVRLLRRRRSLPTVIFLTVAVLVLIGSAPLPGAAGTLSSWGRAWLAQVPAVAGARGLLIGVALAASTTAVRVLLAADRPYGE